MVYYAIQYGEYFFEISKMRGHDDGNHLSLGSLITEDQYKKLWSHTKPSPTTSMYHRSSQIRSANGHSYRDIEKRRGEGKISDIIPDIKVRELHLS